MLARLCVCVAVLSVLGAAHSLGQGTENTGPTIDLNVMRLKRDVDRRIAKGLSVDERLRLNAVMADLAMKPTADVY
ncbi:MAG TPA: hypothetical protein VGJ56_10345, partial [Reyranella sp.]